MWRSVGASLVSWKTTAAATLAALVALLQAILFMIDAEPDTIADWNQVMTLIIAAVLAWTAFFGRDADKSDQDSGIRPDKSKGQWP